MADDRVEFELVSPEHLLFSEQVEMVVVPGAEGDFDPELEPEVRQGFADLVADLEAMNEELKEVTARLGNQPVLFSHPVYQYFEQRYNLNGYSVHWEPDEVPGEAQWRQLESLMKRHPAKLMIWEDEPREQTRRRLSELGVESVVFSPGGNRPAEGDWLDVMNAGIASLRSQ